MSNLKIPRWIGPSSSDAQIEVHGFADSSNKAFGAVIYVRTVHQNQVTVSLQFFKTRIAPIKIISIPRMELCVATLLAKLVKHSIEVMPFKQPIIHLWSDSLDALYWIRDHPSRWQTFVANRCSEIQTLAPNAFWHHVRSHDNPADVISRGIEPTELESHSLWRQGPDFLRNTRESWTTKADSITVVPLEEKKVVHVEVDSQSSQLDTGSIWDLKGKIHLYLAC